MTAAFGHRQLPGYMLGDSGACGRGTTPISLTVHGAR